MPILEVAIGVIFLVTTLSLVVSTLAEMQSQRRGKRASILEEGVRRMLVGGAPVAKSDDFARRVLTHPLLRTVADEPLPDAIDPRTFARAVLAEAEVTQANVTEVTARVREAAGDHLAAIVSGLLDSDPVERREVVERLAEWFEREVGGLGRSYRSWVSKQLLVIAVVLVPLFNADGLLFAQLLWTDAGLRVAKADSAAAFVDERRQGGGELSVAIESQDAVGRIETFPLGWPVGAGWEADPRIADLVKVDGGAAVGVNWLGVLQRLLGWLLTVAAVSLGAPFWFDILRQLVGLRRGSGAEA